MLCYRSSRDNTGIYQGNCVQGEYSTYSAINPPEIIQEFTRVIVFRGNAVHILCYRSSPEIIQEFTRVIVFRGNTVHTLLQIAQR